MNQLLPLGKPIAFSSLHNAQVEVFLGGGTQGEVYRLSHPVGESALKWYFSNYATPQQRAQIEKLIDRGAPDKRFLWPMNIVEAGDIPGFGYLMPLREKRFRSLFDLMKRRIEPSFRELAVAGFQLADSFLQLHAKGLCYRDIAFGNIFLDPSTGDICICDNDNVTVDGDTSTLIAGTPRFMAPEIVRGEANPSSRTDRFSLAVLLFYMLMMHHPLEGKREAEIRCFDLPAMNRLYGEQPLFIFDPDDSSNNPVSGLHDNALEYWPIYPHYLRDLFVQAFTQGLHNPAHGRIRESQWREAMIKLRDLIFHCPCGAENIHDPDSVPSSPGVVGECWDCHAPLRLPPRLRIENQLIVLSRETTINPHHLDPDHYDDLSTLCASIAQHPTNPALWGLKNHTQRLWVVTTPDGRTLSVEPGRSVSLAGGTRINFGTVIGEILA